MGSEGGKERKQRTNWSSAALGSWGPTSLINKKEVGEMGGNQQWRLSRRGKREEESQASAGSRRRIRKVSQGTEVILCIKSNDSPGKVKIENWSMKM